MHPTLTPPPKEQPRIPDRAWPTLMTFAGAALLWAVDAAAGAGGRGAAPAVAARRPWWRWPSSLPVARYLARTTRRPFART